MDAVHQATNEHWRSHPFQGEICGLWSQGLTIKEIAKRYRRRGLCPAAVSEILNLSPGQKRRHKRLRKIDRLLHAGKSVEAVSEISHSPRALVNRMAAKIESATPAAGRTNSAVAWPPPGVLVTVRGRRWPRKNATPERSG